MLSSSSTSSSEFEPYLNYILSKKEDYQNYNDNSNDNNRRRTTTTKNQTPFKPSTWSSAGKTFLQTIQGSILTPQDLTTKSFFTDCLGGDDNDDEKMTAWTRQYLEWAYATVLARTRSKDELFVPLLDLFNHHRGTQQWNVESSPSARTTTTGTTKQQQREKSEDDEDDDDDEDVNDHTHFVKVYTTRAIRAGEQLFLNYMECDDEYFRRQEYSVPSLLRDHGFVEDYPQRWKLPSHKVQYQIIFDIVVKKKKTRTEVVVPVVVVTENNKENGDDEKDAAAGHEKNLDDDDEEEYELHWIMPQKVPAHSVFSKTLRKELTRLEGLQQWVMDDDDGTTTIPPLTDTDTLIMPAHERHTSRQYYQSLRRAYQLSVTAVEAAVQLLPRQANKDKPFMACDDFEQLFIEEGGWYFYEGFTSFHQGIDFYYNPVTKDACLLLNMYLHACISNRPHYHEVFVHYPAHYLEKVERVLFIGGGDSMVLHEVLKYQEQDLQLVVGLELDQQVVRSTFARMGTSPHFDQHEKVEWWFGDAAQALNVLPTEYYGTFDLVIVDILSVVADNLQVTDHLTIMEAALLLMKPEGIIVKNEDEGYVPGNTQVKKTFTTHTVDVMYYDVPVYCLQTFVIGSNSIDFSNNKLHPPVDHNISTWYLNDVHDFQAQFDTWYTSTNSIGDEEEDSDDHKYCQEEETTTRIVEALSPSSSSSTSTSTSSTPKKSPLGMIMIIEAEQIPIELLGEDFSSGIQKTISDCFTSTTNGIGFTELLTLDQVLGLPGGSMGYTLTFVYKEGCVTARCFPEKQYCAVDVQLWKQVHLTERVRKELLMAMGVYESSSVYRIVTSGIVGVEENDTNEKIGPPLRDNKPDSKSDSESCTRRPSNNDSATAAAATTTKSSSFSKRKDPTIEFHNATTDDYYTTAALEQYLSQDPLGEQSIVRYELQHWNRHTRQEMSTLLMTNLYDALEVASEEWEMEDTMDQIQLQKLDIGEGLVIVASWSEGNVVVVWDGAIRVDVNLFGLNHSSGVTYVTITKAFQYLFRRPTLMDDFPRGTGRVVNFLDEIPPRVVDSESGEEQERDHPFWAPEWEP